MRVVIQRVNHAQVAIDNEVVGKIKKGFLLLVGIGQDDNEEVVAKAAQKIAKMRMRPPKADELWQEFNHELEKIGFHVETGHFGADMKVELENDGPFTIVLDLD